MQTEQIISLVADLLGIGAAIVAALRVVRVSFQKYLFLFAFFAAGLAIGLALPNSDWLLVATGCGLLIVICIMSTRPWFDRTMLGGPHVAIGRRAYFNLFCETIHRVCLALGDASAGGNDVRAALFHVDAHTQTVVMVGRYPVELGDSDREIKFEIGRGAARTCAGDGKVKVLEDLPDWEGNSKKYIELMGQAFCLASREIQDLHRKSRSFYNFPIYTREQRDGVRKVRYVVCVDSLHQRIGPNIQREQILNVLTAIGENSVQLLAEDKIGL